MESEVKDSNPEAGEDLTYSEAFKVLNNLVSEHVISEEQAHTAKVQYEELHQAVLAAMAAESARLTEGEVLQKQLAAQVAQAAEKQGSPETLNSQVALDVLREDEEAAHAEVELAEEKEQLQQLELNELQRQRNEVMAQIEVIQGEHRQRLMPQIEQLQVEIAALQGELNAKDSKEEVLSENLSALRAKQAEFDAEKQKLCDQHRRVSEDHDKAAQLPEKSRKQLELVATMHAQVEAQHVELLRQLEERDTELQRKQQGIRLLETQYSLLMGEVERTGYGIEAWQQNIDSVQKEVSMKRLEAEQILSEQAELQAHLRMKQVDVRTATHENKHVTKEKEMHLKRLKKRENALKILTGTLPGLEAQKETLMHDLEQANALTHKQAEQLKAVKMEVDIQMMAFLNEEQDGTKKNALFIRSREQLAELEATITELRAAESQHHRAAQTLAAAREKAARHASVQAKKAKDCKKEGALKEVIRKDLRKLHRAIMNRVKDFQQLYDMVKNQRNGFVNLLQAARQGIAEMREKHKILANELAILRSESNKKDIELVEKHADLQRSVSERTGMRSKLNRLDRDFKGRHDKVDEQIAEIDKLNAIINTAEKDMIRLKKQYEGAVELRNYTGITLIDRNDELCILYEKANIQDTVSKAGKVGLNRLNDEIRHLKIEMAEIARSITVTRRLLPRIPTYDRDVASLQTEILLVRRESERLEMLLEDPENTSRWRMLPGRIKDKDELRIKVNQLEERLNDKKEQLLERELILEEVTSLSSTLRIQAASGRAGTLEVARKANVYQNSMRRVTRKMMATISELSMYQATALKLTAEKDAVAAEVQDARLKLADGKSPTAEAEREWEALLREESVVIRMRATHAEVRRVLGAKGAGVVAPTRPHAYIPEALGIPKPYGCFAPFKPVEPGATMRHFRKPEIREVVI